MIGKAGPIMDKRPHCTNGWDGTKRSPACNYTGGHYCVRLANHKGRCRCTCGRTRKKDH
jgi:hypothetical protein